MLYVRFKHKFNGGFYSAGGVRAESARFASSDNLATLPGYAVINLGAGYQAPKWDATLSLKNLSDRKYYVAGHSGANDYNLLGEPRTLIVATRYRF
jgi:catecholate siderophore receptor